MYRTFCRLGLTFYRKMAIKHDAKAAFFADDEWTMVQAMTDYLDEEKPADEKKVHEPESILPHLDKDGLK